jgi:ABC-type Zn uptake system ZnuABC Zn-binding protein ZnuA
MAFFPTARRSAHHPLRALVAIVAALAIVGPAATTTAAAAQEPEPIKVVATFSILADWAQNVGGDHIELTTIVPAGGDAHTFDPNPEQVASIADADLIFEIGVGFETWLDDMVDASGSAATRVAVSDGVELLTLDEEHGEDEHDGEEHGHGEQDPHIWGDVANASHAVELIRQALDTADPDNAAAYDANAAAYTGQLDTLDATIRKSVQSIPEDQRKLVTTHDTFGYYAHAYGFEIVGTALNSLSTEGGDPPARDIAALVESIQESGVPAIFAENVSNNDLMQVIADEAGVDLAPPLYSDALGEPGSDGDTYIRMMEYNTATIVAALTAG